MFYCNPCGEKRGWPIDHYVGSRGGCEICGVVAICNDVPSSALPDAKPKIPEIPVGFYAASACRDYDILR